MILKNSNRNAAGVKSAKCALPGKKLMGWQPGLSGRFHVYTEV